MNIISLVRNRIERTHSGIALTRMIRKTGIVYFYHAFMYKTFWNGRDVYTYDQHTAEILRLKDLLCDDMSIKTLDNIIKFRKNQDIRLLKEVNIDNQYFQKDLLPPWEEEVLVDGGAYTGDTIYSFMDNYINDNTKSFRIYAWEPEANNRRQLQKNCVGRNVTIVPYGMWKDKNVLKFCEAAGSSCIEEHGIKDIEVNSIDNVHGGKKITFIKMDIEGAEIEALEGAKNTIISQHPKLAICIYHKPEHLYEIPLFIHDLVPEYKLYIRHHSDTISETVLYCTV